MVFADRSLKAGSLEVKAAYQSMSARLEDGVLVVENRYDFTDFAECDFRYWVETDGKAMEKQRHRLTLPPHQRTRLPVLAYARECVYGIYLNCELYRDGKLVAQSQHCLAEGDGGLGKRAAKEEITETGAAAAALGGKAEGAAAAEKKSVRYEQTENEILARGEGFCYRFSKHTGNFTSLEIGGRKQLASPVRLTAWRAPTDNDRNIRLAWGSKDNRKGENLNRMFSKVYRCFADEKGITLEGSLSGISRKPFFRYTLKVEVGGRGRFRSVCAERFGRMRCTCRGWDLSFACRRRARLFRIMGRGRRRITAICAIMCGWGGMKAVRRRNM